MSICVLAERYGVKGQTLRKQYKEKISDYRNWDQLEHAHDYLLYPENIGENLSLDETCLSNGEVYTILTNKAAKGRKGGFSCNGSWSGHRCGKRNLAQASAPETAVCQDCHYRFIFSHDADGQKGVSCRKAINDRFHVQQLMSEAVDRLRIRYRWKVLDAENQAIREHRQKEERSKE